ncbi:hypothetical protein GCK72_000166 [Caenorhabditis remanei]|uniref:Uncharacterized protein n=1 Tax=Caenorhabditis remanei TaxID=31234 RepID=A0A6A5HP40_CAERE|nr:hypothetical protein GCK72_000166 [Caenorhabditis remanei]KAF1768354.1 hypothetical protein GCK72_000166 [Caenorhabditis remanei]
MAAGIKLWAIPLLNVLYLPLLQNKKNVEGRTERQRKAMDCLKENAPEIPMAETKLASKTSLNLLVSGPQSS